MKTLKHLFDRNRAWAEEIERDNPGFFAGLARQQSPEYLWIGCSDSRVSANQIVDMLPGEIFVHRNIANVVAYSDVNCLSVIHYAVEVLKVKHIIVCGHYGCGGIQAAMQTRDQGYVENWLCHVKEVKRQHAERLQNLDEHARFDLLCELNVRAQVCNVKETGVVQAAWKSGQELYVHGWIYDISNGLLKDLEVNG
ncbi:MAG: carbonate dehydratase [Xanthomonadales bacterium]|nr:carbonate dehydratase [Xanthomonadales bacterium]